MNLYVFPSRQRERLKKGLSIPRPEKICHLKLLLSEGEQKILINPTQDAINIFSYIKRTPQFIHGSLCGILKQEWSKIANYDLFMYGESISGVY